MKLRTVVMITLSLLAVMTACKPEDPTTKEELAPQGIAAENLNAGQEFLAANAGKEGVETTKSGLQYKVVTEGAGVSPAAEDTVNVHYHGTLIDGTVFDSSVERGQTISFPLNRVIAGWTEGLQLMKEGGKTIFYIPPDLAYGEQQRSEEIGPNSTLIFEVELFKVTPAAQ